MDYPRFQSRLLSCVLIAAACFAWCIASPADAQVRRFIPPWQAFGHWKSYPNQAADCCVSLPYIQASDELLGSQPPLILTVREATRVALQNSTVVRNLGLIEANSNVDLVQANITRYDPLAAEAAAAAEWGIFDTQWFVDAQWNRQDLPEGVSFGGFGTRPSQLDFADFQSTLTQLLPNGANLEVEFLADYLFNPERPPSLDPNPQYFTYSQVGIVQPVWQGRGVDVTIAPIRIAAAEAEQTDWTFKQEMLALVRSVETTCWALHAEQRNLEVIEAVLPMYREVVRVQEEQAKGKLGSSMTVAQARADMLRFEQQRLDTATRIAEQQLVLRNLLKLPTSDGRPVQIVAAPLMAPPTESLAQAVDIATRRRPEVLRQRLAVYIAQQQRVLTKNELLPVLNFNAFWRINGLDNDLPGSLGVQSDNRFNDWFLGFTYEVPFRRREAKANHRAAGFTLLSERAQLEQVSAQASFEVADAYRRVFGVDQQWQLAADRREAVAKWREAARAQLENPPAGVPLTVAFDRYLRTLRDSIDTDLNANRLMQEYQSALVRLEEAKGTLLQARRVEIAGDGTEQAAPLLDLPATDDSPGIAPTDASLDMPTSDASLLPVPQGDQAPVPPAPPAGSGAKSAAATH